MRFQYMNGLFFKLKNGILPGNALKQLTSIYPGNQSGNADG